MHTSGYSQNLSATERLAEWLQAELTLPPAEVGAVHVERCESYDHEMNGFIGFNAFGFTEAAERQIGYDPATHTCGFDLGAFMWSSKRPLHFASARFPQSNGHGPRFSRPG